ncbi:Protein transport protein S9 plasma membrane t-SNARE [Malassezia sp. CBS 17886]|nr:Protein transport protein S9 plasma membrane t-SNARE [Malassezia sp. CBS 17886]
MKPFFKRGPAIPPVGPAAPPSDPYGGPARSARNAAAPQPSDEELLAEYGAGSQPGRSRVPPGGSYGYGEPQAQSGAGASSGVSAPYYSSDPYGDPGMGAAKVLTPEEEEVESIKQQIRTTKQESLGSTRNALRLARETEETASNTMMKLGMQSDTIGDTERHLDISKAHAARAEDNAREIAQLNQSIFRPKFKRDRKAKRNAQEARAVQRHIDERTDREVTREEVLTSQRRVEETIGGGAFSKLKARFGGQKTPVEIKEERERYQFEATHSDNEIEDEIDANLDDVSSLSARMNVLSRAMGQEVDEQNNRLQRVGDKTSNLDTRIYAGTKRLQSLH